MNTQKLSLNDFDAVGIEELLETKGEAMPPSWYIKGNGSQDGEGSNTNGCPKCKEANEQNGTPIPRRCNGSSHISGSIQMGAIAAGINSGAQALGPTKGVSVYATGMAFLGGYIGGGILDAVDYYSTTYYSGSSSQPTSAPSRARIITGCN
ncbi:hypothetical protein GH721_02165 [Kriegella sp. EG-1]|nr:hypothetical protein [Flavobacteriaceae bacterium EG-1]